MGKYRKKPIVIESKLFNGQNIIEVMGWAVGLGCPENPFVYDEDQGTLLIPTLKGDHTASAGDWIIHGIKGEYYPCKPDIFEQTYEEVS